MVTTQRTCLSQHNIDICSFLNRNRDFIDLLQCEAIPRGQHSQHIPPCFTLPHDADPDIYMDMDSIMDDMMANFVSSATLYEEQKERCKCSGADRGRYRVAMPTVLLVTLAIGSVPLLSPTTLPVPSPTSSCSSASLATDCSSRQAQRRAHVIRRRGGHPPAVWQ
ncbi:unnamed protein product [Phytophthora fragariaefolia]|uniref:Unnamed protein product n=1 Tax=Phytophthora fragariaefolia TaxID=1490495 RepID=A0A9W6XDG4_9STRA|nr:unnamed protein product [Phytophthora fragariaefolia]